jgi:hypothetical protein
MERVIINDGIKLAFRSTKKNSINHLSLTSLCKIFELVKVNRDKHAVQLK